MTGGCPAGFLDGLRRYDYAAHVRAIRRHLPKTRLARSVDLRRPATFAATFAAVAGVRVAPRDGAPAFDNALAARLEPEDRRAAERGIAECAALLRDSALFCGFADDLAADAGDDKWTWGDVT